MKAQQQDKKTSFSRVRFIKLVYGSLGNTKELSNDDLYCDSNQQIDRGKQIDNSVRLIIDDHEMIDEDGGQQTSTDAEQIDDHRGQIDDYSNDDQGQQTGSSIEEIEEDRLTMTEEDRLTT